MHDRWLNAQKLHAGNMTMHGGEMRLAVVTSYDPTKVAVKAMIQPEGVQSGWIPVACDGVGQAAVIVPPSINDQIIVIPQEGDAQQWVMIGRLFSNAAPPPQSTFTNAPIQPGEIGIFAGSTMLHLKADGAWLKGDFHVTGAVVAGYGTGDQVGLQSHKHGTGSAAAGTIAPTAGT